MKHIYTSISLTALALIGCSTEIQNLEPAAAMRREEVIRAAEQCEEAAMRPAVVYGYREVQGRRVAVPIDVQCEPSAWRKAR